MICPILTASQATIFGRTNEVKVECFEEDCGMWPHCRRLGTGEVPWIKDAVLTGIPESEAKGGGD